MTTPIYEIYDRIFKRLFSLSSLSIIGLINGLFGTCYPPDSTVEYANKEFVSMHLDKRLADVFITIQGIVYHLEAQIVADGAIVLRVFEYGFQYAMYNRNSDTVLRFPEPVVIYLDSMKKMPETSTLTINFGTQGTFQYQVKNFFYQEHDIQELNQKKMIILIPFQLLKLRHIIEEKPTAENFMLLQNLINDDIVYSIELNLKLGNVSMDDANQLRELTNLLYDHIYANYEELGGYPEMKPLLDGAIELPLDKYRIRIDELEQKEAAWKDEKTSLEEEIQKLRTLLQEQQNANKQ